MVTHQQCMYTLNNLNPKVLSLSTTFLRDKITHGIHPIHSNQMLYCTSISYASLQFFLKTYLLTIILLTTCKSHGITKIINIRKIVFKCKTHKGVCQIWMIDAHNYIEKARSILIN
jgi:hypothetical protein